MVVDPWTKLMPSDAFKVYILTIGIHKIQSLHFEYMNL